MSAEEESGPSAAASALASDGVEHSNETPPVDHPSSAGPDTVESILASLQQQSEDSTSHPVVAALPPQATISAPAALYDPAAFTAPPIQPEIPPFFGGYPSVPMASASVPIMPAAGPAIMHPPSGEYAYNPQHKVIFSSPPQVLFSLAPDSRLFVGNLASEKTSKEELARIFAQYGDIYEIVLKESYGFVQYNNSESVREAIRMENGRLVGGLKLGRHLCY